LCSVQEVRNLRQTRHVSRGITAALGFTTVLKNGASGARQK